MGMIESKSTDKLMVINNIIERFPVDKIKSVSVVWKELSLGGYDTMPVPDFRIEMYETKDEKEEDELSV